MIGNAIMLMFIGMGIVFIFLVLLNIAISLLERSHQRTYTQGGVCPGRSRACAQKKEKEKKYRNR